MICAGCKTIISLEEEDDTLDCAYCDKVFCSECMVAEDFWQCSKCNKVFCNQCVIVNYYHQDVDDDDHYLTCRYCTEEVWLYEV